MAEHEENTTEPEAVEESPIEEVVEDVEQAAERWALKLKPALAKLFRKRDRTPDEAGGNEDSTVEKASE